MKVLAIGDPDVVDMARDTYPESVVDRVAMRPRKMHKDYDALVSYMVLPRVPFKKVNGVVKSWADALKQGGEFLIFVPALEWAAYQILSPQRSPALIMHLFGTQDKTEHFYSCGFTMMDMRSVLSKAGVAITHAQTGEYMLGEYACECHVLRGVKK